MKASYKAALLSALVLPGVGQLYLKRYARGLVIISSVFAGLGYMIWSVAAALLNYADDIMVRMQDGTTNLQELFDIVESRILTTGRYNEAVFYVLVGIWVFAIIDAYRIGEQRSFQDEETL
ncbi:MAG: DUF5683 domain-containing protein [Syntrophales bacterium]